MPDIWMDVDAAVTIPVNVLSLIDDTDFKSREVGITYDQAGMDLVWNFATTAGVITQTAVTPTTGGDYDWAQAGDAIYNIEMPASGGVSANNDTEGFGWFSGICTGVLPWRGPTIGFRAAGLNNLLIDNAYSATRALAGTALPDAAADAAGGLPVSDAGGLDVDAILADTGELQTNQAAWATATGFSTHDAAAVKTAIEAGGSSIALILADTGELQTNQGAWATATGFSTHDAAAVKTAIEAGGSSIALILADTGELQTNQGAWATATGFSTVTEAQVNAQCDAAIETYGLDHLVAAAVTGTDIADDSIIAFMVSKDVTADWDDFVNTTDSLQAIRDAGGGDATATNQTTIIAHLTDAKGTGFVKDTHSLVNLVAGAAVNLQIGGEEMTIT